MIGKITTGKDFRGLVDYLLDPTKTPEIIDTNMPQDRLDMIWELEYCAQLNPRCKKPVKHISLSFAPEDGKVLNQTIYDIIDAITKGLNYKDNQYLVVKHDRIDPNHDRDHDHDHIHILINMIDYEGKRVKDSFDQRKLEKVLRQQEQKHNLTPVLPSNQRSYKASSMGQVQRMMREIDEYQKGKRSKKPTAPYMIKIQSGIDLASHDQPNLSVFLARLQRLGIDSKFRIEQDEITGISYKMQDFKVRGCKLHVSSWPKLLDHRITLDPEQDLKAIAQANVDEEIELAPGLEVRWSQTNIRDYVPNKMKYILDKTFGENKLEVVSKSQPKKTVDREQKPENSPDQGWEIDF